MKFELTKEQQEDIDHAVKNNNVRKYLTHRGNMQFVIGDILIKKTGAEYDDKGVATKWRVETIQSNASKLAQRYVYVCEDDMGIGYVKPLRVSNGTLGQDTLPLTGFDYDYVRFEVDPEYAESTFLGGDFDIKKIHSASLEQRKIVTKMNRKKGKKLKTLEELKVFFEGVGVGGKFFVSRNFTGQHFSEKEITEMRKVLVGDHNVTGDYTIRRLVENDLNNGTNLVNATYVYKLTFKGSTYERYSFNLLDDVFFLEKPAQEDETP